MERGEKLLSMYLISARNVYYGFRIFTKMQGLFCPLSLIFTIAFQGQKI